MRIEHLLLIGGMALVTYIPRALPLLFLSSRQLNPLLTRCLTLVPPTVLAAILGPELLLRRGLQGYNLHLALDNAFLLAALPAFLVAFLTRSFLGTVIVGMTSVAIFRYLL